MRIFGTGPYSRDVTEADWLTSDDLRLLLWMVEPSTTDEHVSDRKLRLFACACARRVWHLLTDDTRQNTVELAERYADGAATEEELVSRRQATEQDVEPAVARCCLMQGWLTGDGGTYYYLMDILKLLQKAKGKAGEGAADCVLLRDVIGNPFRSIAFAPDWRTENTVGIAAKMYDERDFGAMPILADALEEAGCDNGDILAHCREPGVHVRGCWVVDRVLGKE
jgi:hypothetical protein